MEKIADMKWIFWLCDKSLIIADRCTSTSLALG
jgi:hypothetical protein